MIWGCAGQLDDESCRVSQRRDDDGEVAESQTRHNNCVNELRSAHELRNTTLTTTTAMDSAESFARLVHGANPAAVNRYPPTATTTAMDPFFDDDDDLLDVSNHAFPTRSQESGLPLTDAAAPPAGLGNSSVTLSQQRGWSEDPFQGSASFPGLHTTAKPPTPRKRKKWKWPWEKQVVLTGERVIALNNPLMNNEFPDNFVSTSKYNPVSFLPKFLKGNPQLLPLVLVHSYSRTEQFSKYANLFFLFTAAIQQIPNVSPTNQYTTIVPLAIVLAASGFKEIQEDLVSCFLSSLVSFLHPYRNVISPTPNSTPVSQKYSPHPLRSSNANGRISVLVTSFASSRTNLSLPISYSYLPRNQKDSVSSRRPTSTGAHSPLSARLYSHTSSETNLKIKQASSSTVALTAPSLVTSLHGSLRSEQPNNSLYTYEGTLELLSDAGVPRQIPLGPDQMLLRGAQLRNTPWIYGIVVFTGHETKLMRNAT